MPSGNRTPSGSVAKVRTPARSERESSSAHTFPANATKNGKMNNASALLIASSRGDDANINLDVRRHPGKPPLFRELHARVDDNLAELCAFAANEIPELFGAHRRRLETHRAQFRDELRHFQRLHRGQVELTQHRVGHSCGSEEAEEIDELETRKRRILGDRRYIGQR